MILGYSTEYTRRGTHMAAKRHNRCSKSLSDVSYHIAFRAKMYLEHRIHIRTMYYLIAFEGISSFVILRVYN